MEQSSPDWASIEAFARADSGVSMAEKAAAPEAVPCWAGDWARVDVRTQVWGQAAVLRTVAALPATHPWRLGGTAGSIRQVQWTGRPATVPEEVLCILSVTATDPQLSAGEGPGSSSFGGLGALGGLGGLGGLGAFGGLGATADSLVSDAFDDAVSDVVHVLSASREQRWAGALVRLPGTWLPAAAVLPRGVPGVPSPRTHWATESVEFDERFVVHSENEQVTAALLSPSVMAVLMDAVPRGAAVTISGDALQVWWPYDQGTRSDVGRVQRSAVAGLLLVKTFPRFVLADHPDRSAEVERSLARKADEAHAYRARLTYGRSPDPVLQRIYDQARARIGA
ncbi:MAG: hypothetical protein ACJ71T_14745 [Actinomycetales bacterium]